MLMRMSEDYRLPGGVRLYVPNTPEQNPKRDGEEESGGYLDFVWRSLKKRSAEKGGPISGAFVSGVSSGKAVFSRVTKRGGPYVATEMDAGDYLNMDDQLDQEDAKEEEERLYREACQKVLSFPAAQDLIEVHAKLLAKESARNKGSGKGSDEEDKPPETGPDLQAQGVPLKGENSGNVPDDDAKLKEQIRQFMSTLKSKKRSSINRFQQMLSNAGLAATAGSILKEQMSETPRATITAIPCPQIRHPVASNTPNPYAQAFMANPNANLAWPLRMSGKNVIKIPEFFGGKGYPCPVEAEAWLRALARAVKVNGWSAEDALEHAQSKLTGSAATWYQNRENHFDKNVLGADEGWRRFWAMFERQYVGQDEHALWQQFELRIQLADESVTSYADAIRRMATRLGVSVDGVNVRMRFLKGLSSTQIRAKVEIMMSILPGTFDAWVETASFHDLANRREGKTKVTPANQNSGVNLHGGYAGTGFDSDRKKQLDSPSNGGGNLPGIHANLGFDPDKKRQMDGPMNTNISLNDIRKICEEQVQRHVSDLKREVAAQKQTIVKL